MLGRYKKAPEKAQVKLANQIQAKIDALNPNIKADIANVQIRLDQPMVGGVSFRGEDDDDIHENVGNNNHTTSSNRNEFTLIEAMQTIEF